MLRDMLEESQAGPAFVMQSDTKIHWTPAYLVRVIRIQGRSGPQAPRHLQDTVNLLCAPNHNAIYGLCDAIIITGCCGPTRY